MAGINLMFSEAAIGENNLRERVLVEYFCKGDRKPTDDIRDCSNHQRLQPFSKTVRLK
jgi:hypothetical protein